MTERNSSLELASLLGLNHVVLSDPSECTNSSLPNFIDFIRLMACFANRSISCSEPLLRLLPDACKAEGITLSTDLRLEWTSYTNVLRLRGKHIDALLIPQNLGQQFPLLALLLLLNGHDRAYLSIPNRKHPNIASVPIAKQFAALITGGSKGIPNIFTSTLKPDNCYLCLQSSPHFGHYVMNSLGPANQALAVVRAAGASMRLARIENGFLPLEQEAWLLDPIPPPSPWIDAFPTMQALRQAASRGSHALMVLYGSSVDLSLAITTNRLIKQCSSLTQSSVTRGFRTPSPKEIVLGIGLRGGTREAINLTEVIHGLLLALHRKGRSIYLVIDGMAESPHNNVSTTASLSLEKEQSIAMNLLDANTAYGGRGVSVVGWPLMDQLSCLSYCDLVIGHEGSSSAKSMWLLGKKTLVHSSNPPVVPKPKKPELQAVGLQFRHAYRGDTHPPEIRLPHHYVSVLPETDSSQEARQRRNYTLRVTESILFIMQILESTGII